MLYGFQRHALLVRVDCIKSSLLHCRSVLVSTFFHVFRQLPIRRVPVAIYMFSTWSRTLHAFDACGSLFVGEIVSGPFHVFRPMML
jgi:hypothetical protein